MALASISRGLSRCLQLSLAFASLALSPSPASAHKSEMDEIADVNWAVNSLPLTDCKAFTDEKVARLHHLGIAARFVVVRTETGDYHAIAVVDGTIALDSRRRDVTTVDQLRAEGYSIAPLK